MKKVLLTGARGFIGRHCLDVLLARGFAVHAVSSKGFVNEYRQGVEWHHADLHNAEHILRLLSGLRPEYLLHLAWDISPGAYWHSLENLRWVKSSLGLLQAFIDAGGQRVTMAGSCAEYDWNYGYCTEGLTPLNPATFYGTCKNSLQMMVTAAAREKKINAAWGRMFYVYGPGDHEGRLVQSVVESLLKEEEALCTHGEQVRDYLYNKDAAEALVALLDSSVTGPVNIASGRPVILKELIKQAAELIGRPDLVRLGALEEALNDPHLLLANTERLNKEVGWQPQYSHGNGLQETIDWYKKKGNSC
jgi:nucleoside-diphosphate-sugar epimerase